MNNKLIRHKEVRIATDDMTLMTNDTCCYLLTWMHWTVLVWVPPPQDCEHAVKSDTFQRGGHGFSLHVRT